MPEHHPRPQQHAHRRPRRHAGRQARRRRTRTPLRALALALGCALLAP
ncbi:hypothetical protein GTR00_16905, partial [Kineococcus sp. T90]|nr:hypothetical protein [Kineococcus indalonis]